MGRTGRAGALGTAWSYVTPNDKKSGVRLRNFKSWIKTSIRKRSDNSYARRDSSSKRIHLHRKITEEVVDLEIEQRKFSFRDKPKRSFEKDRKLYRRTSKKF